MIIKAVELFVGAGGLALGLHQAGISNVLMVEKDKNAVNTIQKNQPTWNIVHDDVGNVDFTKLSDIDLVVGGFPCQAFSTAGKKLGFDDIRGSLFFQLARCIKETMPKVILGENVKGLLSHDKGKTFDVILTILEQMGYKVFWKVLKAHHYGVPQKRERLFVVCLRNDFYEKNKPSKQDVFPKETTPIQHKTLKDALVDCPLSVGGKYSANRKAILELVPPGGWWKDLPEDIKKSYMGKDYENTQKLNGGSTGIAKRLSWEQPAPTLLCCPIQKRTERCHPDETRPLTIREYARIQTFPDDWVFCGSVASQYRQIGNAVPVLLGKAVGETIVGLIEGEGPNGTEKNRRF